MEIDYLKYNLKHWNERVEHHIASEFYDMDSFIKGQTSLNSIELDLLGSVKDLDILHLQCHFGQDTLSLAREGANVTGVDLSDKAILEAQKLTKQLNLEADFICCDVYDTLNHIKKPYDLVFTTYGTIGWLPDLDKWANVVSQALKPGGQLLFVDFHPFVWMYDSKFEEIAYSYFNTQTIVEENFGTYANPEAKISSTEVSWNHPLSEVFASITQSGLQIIDFKEYNYSPYNCFPNMVKLSDREYQFKHFENKFPMVYSLMAQKLS